MPTIVPHPLLAADGRVLAGTRYVPDGRVRAPVVILGAYAVRQRYYRRFATWLAERGFEVLTFDTRGIGDSLVGHPKDEPVTATQWATLDHAAALDWLARQDGPRLAVGHSFGGQVPGITDAARCVDGLYTVASQLGHWGYHDGVERLRMQFLMRFAMPSLTRAFGYLPAWTGMGEDIPPNAMLEWTRWLKTPRYLLDHVRGAEERFKRFPGELVSVGFTDDTYAAPRGVAALAECYDPSRTSLRMLTPRDAGMKRVDHFGFFRPEAERVLWRDALSHLDRWVDDHADRASVVANAQRPTSVVAR
ncbi:MAG: alpha/beta fold hydrolase [Polyangiales bacterium]